MVPEDMGWLLGLVMWMKWRSEEFARESRWEPIAELVTWVCTAETPRLPTSLK